MDRQEPESAIQARQFLADLTELSVKHGIAIGGEPVLFMMEPDDQAYSYQMDEQSRVTRA